MLLRFTCNSHLPLLPFAQAGADQPAADLPAKTANSAANINAIARERAPIDTLRRADFNVLCLFAFTRFGANNNSSDALAQFTERFGNR